MSKEMCFFIYLLEAYASEKGETADVVLRRLNEAELYDVVFNMYQRYHTEALENAFADIDQLFATVGKR